MKKVLTCLLGLSLCVSVFAFSGCSDSGGSDVKQTTLYVYNWGEYIPDGTDGSMDVIKEFETRNPDIKVVYDTYTSNEALYAKLKSGASSYDVIIPSDYMIGRLIEEEMLEKIDSANIPNYANIMDSFKNASYDPQNEYSVPYEWGTVGVIYNKTMVDGTPDSWNILWDQNYAGKILMFNNSRDAFGIAEKLLGYSQNTTSETELQACAEKLKEQKPLVQSYVMDEIFDKMENGEAALAPYYAGDALTMMSENEDLGFYIPKEGSNKFVDAMCIPKGAKNKAAAEKFINFILDPEVGKEICSFIGYSTPNQASFNLLDDDTKNSAVAYPSQDILANCEFFENLPKDTNQLMQDLWVEIKTD